MSDKARSEHFLLKIEPLIDWAALAPMMQGAGGPSRAGLSPAVVKMRLLARWYEMNESALLEACQDRMSFRRFLGLPLTDTSGDAALRDAFRRHVLQGPMEAQKLIDAIEAQLLAQGLTIKPGKWAEAHVVPVPGQPGAKKSKLAETTTFQAGEMEKLLAQGKSLAERAGNAVQAPPPARPDSAPLQASIEWPWGVTTKLAERLAVGRDYGSCPYAAELASYPHLSRKHAELTTSPLGVWVRDLRSHNGTFVNEERLAKGNAHLVDADAHVRFGPYCVIRLKFGS